MYGYRSFIWGFVFYRAAYVVVALVGLVASSSTSAMPSASYNAVAADCTTKASKNASLYLNWSTALPWTWANGGYSHTACDPTEPSSQTGWCQVRWLSNPDSAAGYPIGQYAGFSSLITGKWLPIFTGSTCAVLTSPTTGCASPDNAGLCDYIGSVQQVAARAEAVSTQAANELVSVNSSLWGTDYTGEYLSAGDRLARLNDWTRWGVEENIATRNATVPLMQQSVNAANLANTILSDLVNKPDPTVTVDTTAMQSAQAATTSAIGTTNSRLSTITSSLTSNNTKTDATNTKLDSVQNKIDSTTSAVNNANSVLSTAITGGNASIRDKVIEGNSELVSIRNFESALNDKVSNLNANTDGLEIALNGLGVDQRQTTAAIQNSAEYVAAAINNKVIPPPDMSSTNAAIAAASTAETAATGRMEYAINGLNQKSQEIKDWLGSGGDDLTSTAGKTAGESAGASMGDGGTLTQKVINMASFDSTGFLGARVSALPVLHVAVPMGFSDWSTDIDFDRIRALIDLVKLLMWVSVWFMVLRILLGGAK